MNKYSEKHPTIQYSSLLLIISCLLTLIKSNAQSSIPYTYKSVQIGGGGYVTGVIFSEVSKDIIYSRTDIGGAYRWDKTTGSWVQMLNFLGHDDFYFSNVESIAADPVDSNRVYVACGQDTWSGAPKALFRSTDKGVTFEQITPPFEMGGNNNGRGNGERLQVDPNDNSILFMGSRTKGLFKSIDYGSSWVTVTSLGITTTANAVGINAVVFDKRSATSGNATQTIYISVSRTGNNIYRSTDGGATWVALAGQPNNSLLPHRMKLSADGILYITYSNTEGPGGGTSGAIWKYNTSTSGWTNISPASGAGFGGICPDKQNPGVLMATTIGFFPDKIYRSTDRGATWKNVGVHGTNKVTRNTDDAPWVSWHSTTPDAGHWVDDIEIDPFDSGRVMYIDGGGIWGSENINNSDSSGNITWHVRTKGIEEMGGWGSGKNIISPPDGPYIYTAFGDIGGFRHYNLDVSPPDADFYNPIGNSNTSIDIAWKNPSFLVRTNYETTRGSYTTDGGASWKDFATCPDAATNNADNDPGYIATSAKGTSIVWQPRGSDFYYSANKGSTWTKCTGAPVPSASWNRFVPVADKVNDSLFYTQDARNGKIYSSSNKGINWSVVGTTPAPSDAGGWAMQTVYDNTGHLWLPQGTVGLYRSVNKGVNWTQISGVQACEQVGFGKADIGKTYPTIFIYAKMNNLWGFYRSIDEGATWVQINDDQHNFGWIAGMCGDPKIFGRVYIMTSGRGVIYGDTEGANYDCNGIDGGTAYYACGTCAGGNTGIQPCAPTSVTDKTDNLLFAVSPNPFSTSLYVQTPVQFDYSIVNMYGQVLETGSRSGNASVGESLKPGIYILMANSEGKHKSIKIIKH